MEELNFDPLEIAAEVALERAIELWEKEGWND